MTNFKEYYDEFFLNTCKINTSIDNLSKVYGYQLEEYQPKFIKSEFILVRHDADKARLHFDLRFQKPNSKDIWISFAIRKGIPKQGQKVLAIRTHDHTRKEALFLGKIEKGYGAGDLKEEDSGNCEIIKYHSSHMVVDFKGKKGALNGTYHFINIGILKKKYVGNNKRNYKAQQYLFFKSKN